MRSIANIRVDTFSNSYNYSLIDDYEKFGFEMMKLVGQYYTHYSAIQNMIEYLAIRMLFPRTKLSVSNLFCGENNAWKLRKYALPGILFCVESSATS